ncbi:unnamed protein product [Penicillium pancosmium]
MDISFTKTVDMYDMPPQEQAKMLFDSYLRTVHPFFPIINRPVFTAQYQTFSKGTARSGDKWLAILNMIFAIAAKHAHLVDAPWQGDERDYLLYLTRARLLSMNGDVLFSHPDLQQIQVEGLIAFYLLSSNQVSRAWRISALAVRSAINLGINMKNTSLSTPDTFKESRYRVWWCLYTLEHTLGIMTGRATCILDRTFTTPLPIPFEENQWQKPEVVGILNNARLRDDRINKVMTSARVRYLPLNPTGSKEATHNSLSHDNSWVKSLSPSFGLVYLYYCDLTIITQEIVNKVYFLDRVMVPWEHIKNRIVELRSRIDQWYKSLPSTLDFKTKSNDDSDQLRCQLALAFHFYSARIMLGRACPHRSETQRRSLAGGSFSDEMAALSLESAMEMLALISDEPSPIQLYEISPWWCLLHYLMQAATVLLLELSFGSVHMPERKQNLIELTKKSVRWLYAMSEHSVASQRAWQLCDVSLRRFALDMSFDVSDIPLATYHPSPTTDSTLETNDVSHSDHFPGISKQGIPGPSFDLFLANHLYQPFQLGSKPVLEKIPGNDPMNSIPPGLSDRE